MSQLLLPPYIVGMPTETVYGLAARIDCPEGIKAIFKVKQRPFFDPLIVHVASIQQAKELTSEWPVAADILAKKFWPGPLTLILKKSEVIDPMITSGLERVGIRMPRHPLALQLIEEEGPLAAPSANLFGRTSPTTAEHVRSEFKNLFPIIDGGQCEVGLESTVVLISENSISILRPGAITKSQLMNSLPQHILYTEAIDTKTSPGQLKHHYMPAAPLVIIDSEKIDLKFIKTEIDKLPDYIEGVKITKPTHEISNIIELILPIEPIFAARKLYSLLREISLRNPDLIIFKMNQLHYSEEWGAVIDRLTKAAALRVK